MMMMMMMDDDRWTVINCAGRTAVALSSVRLTAQLSATVNTFRDRAGFSRCEARRPAE